ncbi:MAG: hypothetical protein ACLQDF_14340 [Desulfomonilia bacterium]
MMNEQEKSDPSIVAEKPTNKQGQPSAEPAERREGAKGNSEETHMRRTQGRGSVSQGLDRVRQAAYSPCRQTPKVGARCVNCARRDLCGGCSVRSIPTAI